MDCLKENTKSNTTGGFAESGLKSEEEGNEFVPSSEILSSFPDEESVAERKAAIKQEMEAVREEREKKDNAVSDQLIAIHGAKIKFNGHLGEFKVLNNVPTTQDKLTGTTIENQITNFTFYDGFVLNSLELWQDVATVKYQDNEALIKKSTLPGVGKMPGNTPPESGKIEFLNSGQVHIPENLVMKGAPLLDDGISKINGYYYNFNGFYEGHISDQKTGNESDVFSCDGKGSEKDTFLNPIKLKITHSDFQRVCNIVKHEGLSNEENEYIYIAHANYNEGKDKNTTMLARLMTTYSSVELVDKKTALSDVAVDSISKYSRKGVIDALLRDIDSTKLDPTDGARFWDGVDFLAWGINTELKADSTSKLGHNKFDEYDSVKIKKSLYDEFVTKIKQKYPNGAPYKSKHDLTKDKGTHRHKETSRGPRAVYTIPATDFKKVEYWLTGDFFYKNPVKFSTSIVATRVAGYSIFWKEIK